MKFIKYLVLVALFCSCAPKDMECSSYTEFIFYKSTLKASPHYNEYMDEWDTLYTCEIAKGFDGRYGIYEKRGFYHGTHNIRKLDSILPTYPFDMEDRVLHFNQTIYCN